MACFLFLCVSGLHQAGKSKEIIPHRHSLRGGRTLFTVSSEVYRVPDGIGLTGRRSDCWSGGVDGTDIRFSISFFFSPFFSVLCFLCLCLLFFFPSSFKGQPRHFDILALAQQSSWEGGGDARVPRLLGIFRLPRRKRSVLVIRVEIGSIAAPNSYHESLYLSGPICVLERAELAMFLCEIPSNPTRDHVRVMIM